MSVIREVMGTIGEIVVGCGLGVLIRVVVIDARRDSPPAKTSASAWSNWSRHRAPPTLAEINARNREAAGGSISGDVAAQVRELNRRSREGDW